MRNVHQRRFPVPAAAAGALLDRLASPADSLWPQSWPAVRFDRPLAVGAVGGHGPIRYRVTSYLPGRLLELTFTPATKVRGAHTLVVEPDGDHACIVRHVLEGTPEGTMRLGWPLMFRWLHDALLEDLFDTAERALTGNVAAPARWSWWVRFLRRRLAARGAMRPRREQPASSAPETAP
jgi:hypothetical protein